MKIKPVGNKLLVKVLPKKEEKTEGGIVVPEAANAELREGEVIEVSDQLKDVYPEGSIILYPEKSGVGQMYGDPIAPHLWLNSDNNEIWGIVKPDTTFKL